MKRINYRPFPANAGMNRNCRALKASTVAVPRERGDEPWFCA